MSRRFSAILSFPGDCQQGAAVVGTHAPNITLTRKMCAMVDYLEANPVHRGLAAKAEDWEWSSARWFAGIGSVKIEKHRRVLMELQWE